MYGDCPVMLIGSGGGGATAGSSSGGAGNNMMMSSALADHPFFSSPLRNPNHSLSTFMASLPPFHGFSSIVPVSSVPSPFLFLFSEIFNVDLVMSFRRRREGWRWWSTRKWRWRAVARVACNLTAPPAAVKNKMTITYMGRSSNNSRTAVNPRRSVTIVTRPTRFKKWKRECPQNFMYNFLCNVVLMVNDVRLFKECPHPDDKQRLKLSQDLGLKPRQVKFWFQNRRTQMKVRVSTTIFNAAVYFLSLHVSLSSIPITVSNVRCVPEILLPAN